MINIEHLSKVFCQKKWNGLRRISHTIEALKDIHTEIEAGSIAGILGHNGAGKSTLLKILSGVLTPTTGRILINGQPIHGDKGYLKNIGICIDNERGFFNKLTGIENLEYYAMHYGLSKKDVLNRIEELESFFQLGKNLRSYYQYYSSGNRKRLALMRAFLHAPSILVLDEITDNLDPIFREKMLAYLLKYGREKGKIILFATQRIEEAEQLCSHAILLNRGRMVYSLKTEVFKGRLSHFYRESQELKS